MLSSSPVVDVLFQTGKVVEDAKSIKGGLVCNDQSLGKAENQMMIKIAMQRQGCSMQQ